MVYGKLEDDLAVEEALKDSLNVAKKIKDPSYQTSVLEEIASAYGQLKDDLVVSEGLKTLSIAVKAIKDPYYQSLVLGEIASAYGQLGDLKAAEEGLKDSFNAAKEIKDPYYQSEVLNEIASVYGQLEDLKAARETLQHSLNAAKKIDSNSDNVLQAIATATGNINNPNIRQSLLQDILPVAEVANANEALAEISYQYALDGLWGKALNALKRCPESEKVPALTNILTLYAEKQKPQLIDGAVVLEVEAKPIDNKSNSYTFTVSIQNNNEQPDEYIDRWEILTEKGKLIYSQNLAKNNRNQQPFDSTSKPIVLDSPQKVVIVRAHLKTSDNDKTGYEARQGWKGSVKKGFKFIRLSPNFATNK